METQIPSTPCTLQQLRDEDIPTQCNRAHIKLYFYSWENTSTVKEIKLLEFEDTQVQINALTHTSPQLKKTKETNRRVICSEK
ncbi:hypothetical protein Cadr_000009243 [Camelus dromedarius]|uniref:Uncharacterized protein n=1 Tax=Camelus dromedarius TaxID=9838 RepID=A0A5N4DIR7_CAMDR|nr:hypothetical protein Cadr_000009243 [Camelus dromedarius]